ncbi:GMP reductase 1 [Takifugu flavidus]|uniref:GMP reductase n=1 Tax=Takifugu flavidus TaxID=433684 RepID=A0A5C6NEP8_9TELE|nr:GMP reductase 1 [Takifugu flavidus]
MEREAWRSGGRMRVNGERRRDEETGWDGPPSAINTLAVWRFGFGGWGLGPATTTAAGAFLRGLSSSSARMPRVDADLKLDFKDVLFRPKRSSLKSRSESFAPCHKTYIYTSLGPRELELDPFGFFQDNFGSSVDLQRTFTFRNSKQTYTGIPIIAANMDTTGTFEMARVLSKHTLFTAIHKHYSVEDWKNFAANHPECLEHVAASSGSGTADLEKLCAILEAVPALKYICLDVANGYSEHFVEFVKMVRERFPKHTIMAGNVVTGEMVEELILSGADIIKVGIGPGSVCTTRIKTGVGYPQLSAVIECADSAHGLKGHIISDGGCSCPGDVAKAFGAGADFVMMGGMLAGHDQCSGEVIEKNGKKYKLFYGMSSDTAMKKYVGGIAEYRASEGKTVEVPYRGDVENTIRDVLGGLRSTCTYVGAARLKELSKRTTFIRVTQQASQMYT